MFIVYLSTGASLFGELRNSIFSKVAQTSIRKLSRRSFSHLHSLDLAFHLSRDTGGLFRALDRGTRAINFIMNAMVFNLLPTSFEVLLVAGLLTYNCGWEYGAVSMLTMFVYSMFTFSVTQWRTRWVVRKRRIYDNCSKSRLCHYIRWLLYSSGHYIQVVTQMMYRCPLSTGGYCVKVTAIHMWLLPLWLSFPSPDSE